MESNSRGATLTEQEYILHQAQAERTRVLENLITITERQISRTPDNDPFYESLRKNLEGYRSEFRTLAGRDYDFPSATAHGSPRRGE